MQATLALQILNRYLRWVLLLVILITLFLGYSFVLAEHIDKVKNVAQQSLKAKEKVLSDLQSIKISLDNDIRDFGLIIDRKRELLVKLDALLPQGSQYGDLFALVDGVTRQSGLVLNNINIAFADEGQTPPGSEQSRPASAQSTVKTIKLNLSVEGGNYETFKRYLDVLQRNVRLFDVQTLSFDGGAFASKTGDDEELSQAVPQYDIELITYYLD